MRLPPTENRFNRHARLRYGVGNDGLKNQTRNSRKGNCPSVYWSS